MLLLIKLSNFYFYHFFIRGLSIVLWIYLYNTIKILNFELIFFISKNIYNIFRIFYLSLKFIIIICLNLLNDNYVNCIDKYL